MFDTGLEPVTSVVGGRRLDDWATEAPDMGKEWRRDGEGKGKEGGDWSIVDKLDTTELSNTLSS